MPKNRWLLPMLLFAATLAAYAPGLNGAFLWNDSDYLTAPALRSWSGLGRIWFDVGAVQQYYPVVHSAFWIEHRLWGDALSGYHLLNILLHATAALLFVFVLQRLLARTPGGVRHLASPQPAGSAAEGRVADRAGGSSLSAWAPWFAGFFFALHPVCAESVNWISEEKNTISTVFYLLAALTYLKWVERADLNALEQPRGGSHASGSTRSTYFLALFLYILAILSKSFAATLPAALLVALWWRQGRLGWRKDVVPLLPWFGLGAVGGLFTAWVEFHFIGAQGSGFGLSLVQRLLVAGRVVWFYLGKLIWPHPLIFIYPKWTINAASAAQYLFPLGLLGLVAALWAMRGRSRSPLAALLFFVGSLFPVLGFFNVYAFNFSYVADHFQYLPCLGPIALAAGAWALLRDSRLAGALAAAVLVTCGVLTWSACRDYRDLPTFYEAILRKNPSAWMAHNNLGGWLRDQGRIDEARAQYQAALQLRPDYVNSLDNLGLMLADKKRWPEAIGYYRAAIRSEPRFADAHRNLANALFQAGRVQEAMVEYQETLRLKKDDAHVWNDYGFALYTLNRIDEAADKFRTALRLDPYDAEAHGNLGNALMRLGDTRSGLAEFETALRLAPDDIPTRNNYGLALAQSGHLEEAMAQFQAVLKARPDLEEAHNDYGNVLLALRRPREAVEEFEAALRINPRSAQAHNNVGNVLFRTGHPREAAAEYRAALEIEPNYIESHVNLGSALCRLGQMEEGAAEFRAALALDPSNQMARRNLERAEAGLSGPTR